MVSNSLYRFNSFARCVCVNCACVMVRSDSPSVSLSLCLSVSLSLCDSGSLCRVSVSLCVYGMTHIDHTHTQRGGVK